MNWIKQCEHEAKSLTVEKRQKVLDDLHSGKTIGETRVKHGLTLAAVCGVVDMNIVDHSYLSLNTETK